MIRLITAGSQIQVMLPPDVVVKRKLVEAKVNVVKEDMNEEAVKIYYFHHFSDSEKSEMIETVEAETKVDNRRGSRSRSGVVLKWLK